MPTLEKLFGGFHTAALTVALLLSASTAAHSQNRASDFRSSIITGTLSATPVAGEPDAVLPFATANASGMAGVEPGDGVEVLRVPQMRRDGRALEVALVHHERKLALMIDTSFNGRFEPGERAEVVESAVHSLTLALGGGTMMPFRYAVEQRLNGGWILRFNAEYTVTGSIDIGGTRTLVALPFDIGRGAPSTNKGKIGVDANGDGVVNTDGTAGPEFLMATNKAGIMKVRDAYISLAGVDWAKKTVAFRTHAATEYLPLTVVRGETLRDFEFTDLNGKQHRLSEYRGKMVLLDFWGTWCGPCFAEFPGLKALYKQYKALGFEIIGIDYEKSTKSSYTKRIVGEQELEWVITRPEATTELVNSRFKVRSFPWLVLLDTNGVVLAEATHLARSQIPALLSTALPGPP